MSASHTLAIDLGTGSCRAIIFDAAGEPARASGSASGRMRPSRASRDRRSSTPAPAGGSCASASRAALDAAAAWRPRTSPRSAAPACARAWSSTTGTGARSGPARTSTRGPPAQADRAGRAAGAARRIFERGGDWVSITSPARFLWIARARAGDLPGHGPRGHAQRLGPHQADGPLRHRPLVRLQLGPLRPAARAPGRPTSLELIGVPPEVMPEVLEPGTVMGEVSASAAAETGLAAGTPVVVGGGDTQLGLIGLGVLRPGTMTLLGGSFWQLTLVTDAAAHRPAGARADALPRAARAVDDRGHRLLLRHRHALAAGRAVRAGAGGG